MTQTLLENACSKARHAHVCLSRESVKFVGLCRDVRAAVDLCHRDGSLKRSVAENPAKYIHEVHFHP